MTNSSEESVMNSVQGDIEHRIGERVRALREQEAMTQAEFARYLRPSLSWYVTTVSSVENGRRVLRFSEAVLMCRAFDVELNVLAP
jgi:transcriptional regulator with XRE-family HTH domain